MYSLDSRLLQYFSFAPTKLFQVKEQIIEYIVKTLVLSKTFVPKVW